MPSILSIDAINHPQLELENYEEPVVQWLINRKKEIDEKRWNDVSADMYTFRSYDKELEHIRNELNLNIHVWKYFQHDNFILDDWKFGSHRDCVDDTYIVFKHNDSYVMLEDLHEIFPFWKDNLEEFFKMAPLKNIFYIIRQA